MKAVWSFWSKPYLSGRKAHWVSEKHHWLSWVLSLETASRHYPETCLVTDSNGADILMDRLGLKFSQVSTELDALADENPEWWALGKLYTYHVQQDPFVHIDNDVYLWKRLPENLESVDVFVQNPEPFSETGAFCYQPERVERAFQATGGWLPEEWLWYRQDHFAQRGECCGILGGQHTEFIRHYARQALRLALDPANYQAWQPLGDKGAHMTLVEQYLLAACVEFHNANKYSAFHPVQIRYLFDSPRQAYRAEAATQAGFTHLIANAKKSPIIANYLEDRVKHDYPEDFQRCMQFSAA
jgi:Family of unknown function (DUF6734)